MLVQNLQHRLEDLRIRGDDVAAVEILLIADEIADEAARFLHEQYAGRHVPRLESELPEAVGATCRYVSEIERSRAGAANAAALARERFEHRHIGIEVLADVLERYAGREHRVLEPMSIADADTFAVHMCAGAARCRELFVADRIDDHRVLEPAAILGADRHAEVRNSVQIVRRAVEWIDDPRVFGAGERIAVFLADDAVIGIRLVQYLDDRVLRIAIDVGYKIVVLLFDDVQRVDAIHRAHDDLSRATSGAKRHVDHCVH